MAKAHIPPLLAYLSKIRVVLFVIEDSLQAKIDAIRRKDRRFPSDAYHHALGLVDFAKEQLPRRTEREQGPHISVEQLISAAEPHAFKQYGYMADLVMEKFGLTSKRALGEVVFNLISEELLSRGPNDSRVAFDSPAPLVNMENYSFETISFPKGKE